jgi:hypothetical protein
MVLEYLTDVFIHSFCRGTVQNVGCLLLDCSIVVLSSGLRLMINQHMNPSDLSGFILCMYICMRGGPHFVMVSSKWPGQTGQYLLQPPLLLVSTYSGPHYFWLAVMHVTGH